VKNRKKGIKSREAKGNGYRRRGGELGMGRVSGQEKSERKEGKDKANKGKERGRSEKRDGTRERVKKETSC